jgi:hypothetical protein
VELVVFETFGEEEDVKELRCILCICTRVCVLLLCACIVYVCACMCNGKKVCLCKGARGPDSPLWRSFGHLQCRVCKEKDNVGLLNFGLQTVHNILCALVQKLS